MFTIPKVQLVILCASQSHSAPRVLPSVFYTTSQTATSTWFPFTPTCRLALFQRGTRDTEATSLTRTRAGRPKSTGEGSRTALEGHKPRRTTQRAQSRRLFSSARERARATEREREREGENVRRSRVEGAWKGSSKCRSEREGRRTAGARARAGRSATCSKSESRRRALLAEHQELPPVRVRVQS